MILKIGDITDITVEEVGYALESGEALLVIDSYGGDLFAGFKIYEMIRNSNANISARVEGKCYSAASLVLLGVKPENRTATKLSSFMIHSPLLTLEEGTLNLSESEQLTEDIRTEFNRLLGVYVDRLNATEDEIKELMLSEKTFDANKALELGFISRIDNYLNKMKKNTNWLAKMFQKFINEAETVETENGDMIEVSELPLKVGVLADVNDGVYKLKDGTVITVESGTIIDIQNEPKIEEELVPEETNEETVVEEVSTEEEKVEEIKEEATPLLEEKVEELAEAKTVEDLAEVSEDIKAIIEEAVSEAVSEAIAKVKSKKKECREEKKMVNKAAKKDFTSMDSTNRSESKTTEDYVKRFWK